MTRLVLAPLSEAEAAELVGESARELYEQTGGNPFYLEQLARVRSGERGGATAADGSIPAAVAAALASELGTLAPEARALLDAAAVVGDPFEPGLAAEVAELSEAAALHALDALLARGLVRSAGAPRRFAFRHPLVRHAVYVATPGGWRLGAHDRGARALERHGAGVVARAHHVEHAARPGDEQAIALLAGAARELQSAAPGTAAQFQAAALRLLPDQPQQRERRTQMQALLADAQAAAGDAVAARETLLEARRQDAGGDVEYVLGDFMTHPFEPASFDHIASIAALHHMDAAAALERMRRLLTPGGTLAIVGLARRRYPADLPFALAGAVGHRVHTLSKPCWQDAAPESLAAPATFAETKRLAARVLPGVRYRRLLLFRYALVWTKLGRASSAGVGGASRR